MDADEKDICNYLKNWPKTFVSGREIARRAAGKRRFHQDPNWAIPVLSRLVEQGEIEADAMGYFRLNQKLQESRASKRKRWLSPTVRSILESTPGQFTEILDESDESSAR